MPKMLIYDLDFESFSKAMADLGQQPFRARQIWSGLYQQHYGEFSQITNISGSLRAALSEQYTLNPLTPRTTLRSKDQLTEKTLFGLPDDLSIETVLMRYEDRNSLCISTQVGCPLGCVFCATGQMGYQRGLTAGEILAQVINAMRLLQVEGKSLTNIVFMGMGEPFLNYEATMDSLRRLTDPTALNFGARRITVSTVGIIPKIEKFSHEGLQVNLAVSLHSADNELRSQLVPANRIYPLKNLLSACRAYTEETHRRVSFEYALINDVNDSPAAAAQLAGLLRGMLCHVNLIALNPSKQYPLQGSPREIVRVFADTLSERGIPVTVRLRRGIEIQAGCGQLASSQNPL